MAAPKGGKLCPDNYQAWTAIQLADYLKTQGLGNYTEMILAHDITGKVAPRLSESDLKEMGITTIGDRKRFQEAIEEIQKTARKVEREKVIWEGDQVLWVSCWDAATSTCCGCCPQDPSHYKLTGTHLSITTPLPARCGPIPCCYGHEYHIDNIDLTYIVDADIKGEAPNCFHKILCCGRNRDHVQIKTSADSGKELVLERGQGEPVSRTIMNQVEEAQRMERD